eukprot:gene3265-1593_t
MPNKEIYLQEKILGRHYSGKSFRVLERNKVFERSNSKELEAFDLHISKLRIEKERINAARQKLILSRKLFNSTGKVIQSLRGKTIEDDVAVELKLMRRANSEMGLAKVSPTLKKKTTRRQSLRFSFGSEKDNDDDENKAEENAVGKESMAIDYVADKPEVFCKQLCSPRTLKKGMSCEGLSSDLCEVNSTIGTEEGDDEVFENGDSVYEKPSFSNELAVSKAKKVHFKDELIDNPKHLDGKIRGLSETLKCTHIDETEMKQHKSEAEEKEDTLPPINTIFRQPRYSVEMLIPGSFSPRLPRPKSKSGVGSEADVLPRIVERRRRSLLNIDEIQKMVKLHKDSNLGLKK